MCYLSKDNLTAYIMDKHKRKKGLDISPIKLQKSLYLLYAMWGGNAKKLNKDLYQENNKQVCEEDNTLLEDLFQPNFQAWQYGPVDPDVYRKFKHDKFYTPKKNIEFKNDNLNDGIKGIIISFIDENLDQIFDISDFTLVDITHEDASWKNIYDEYPAGNGEMDPEEIKEEYYKMMC